MQSVKFTCLSIYNERSKTLHISTLDDSKKKRLPTARESVLACLFVKCTPSSISSAIKYKLVVCGERCTNCRYSSRMLQSVTELPPSLFNLGSSYLNTLALTSLILYLLQSRRRRTEMTCYVAACYIDTGIPISSFLHKPLRKALVLLNNKII